MKGSSIVQFRLARRLTRRLALLISLSFTWSAVFGPAAQALASAPLPPPGTIRPLSEAEMEAIAGMAAISVGNAMSWEGTYGDVKTTSGNKLTSVPIVGWTARGGMPVQFILYHNSGSSDNTEVGYKWSHSYRIRLMMDDFRSTRGITSSTQSATDSILYDGFGMTLSRSGTTPTPFGFVGAGQYQTDADSGLQLLGHRYYDPSVGRFITRDPAKEGRNWYGYCENSPLSSVDVSGEVPLILAGALIVGLILLPERAGPPDNYYPEDGPGPLIIENTRVGDVIAIGVIAKEAVEKTAELAQDVVEIFLPRDKYPEAAAHIEDAIANGHPRDLTYDPGGAADRRRDALGGTQPVPGKDRDEYPQAVSREGGRG